MAYLNSRVYDWGLEVLVRATSRVAIHSEEPTDWDTAMSTALGSTYTPQMVVGNPMRGLVIGPMNALPNGRMVTVGPVTFGYVAIAGSATHWSLLDDVQDRLLASGAFDSPLDVVVDDSFTLNAFDIIIPGV